MGFESAIEIERSLSKDNDDTKLESIEKLEDIAKSVNRNRNDVVIPEKGRRRRIILRDTIPLAWKQIKETQLFFFFFNFLWTSKLNLY